MSSIPARIGRSWRALTADQRLAGIGALALLASMVLPWYEVTVTAVVRGAPRTSSDGRSAFEVYSFVEAAIFVVAAGVLALLYARGERRAFHLPGGDGTVILAGGLWVMFLVFYRQLDKPDVAGPGTTVGVAWGIFVTFLLGALLTYAGYRIRASHTPEPMVDEQAPPESVTVRASAAAGARPDHAQGVGARRPAASPDDEPPDGRLSFDEPAEYRPPPRRS